MKIAIFHELTPGGAYHLLDETERVLQLKNHVTDIYTLDSVVYSRGIIKELLFILFLLPFKHKAISKIINKERYDLVLIFPSIYTQAPYILNYLKNKNNTIYLFGETKREFYEKTSFDYFSIKRILTRIIRFPLKIIDLYNCKNANNIITFSYFSQYELKKNYGKLSTVIYPGLSYVTPTSIEINNNNKVTTVGLHSYLKGHDITIDQFSNSQQKITLLGRRTKETKVLLNMSSTNQAKFNFVYSENDDYKTKLLKKSTFFISNMRKEPFGLATLEAVENNCYVLGLNEGGTSEIVRHGLNGLLYPNYSKVYKSVTSNIISKNHIKSFRFYEISWIKYVDNILSLYHFLKHEPNE